MPIRSTACPHGSQSRNFPEKSILARFVKICRKLEVSSKSNKNIGNFTRRPKYFLSVKSSIKYFTAGQLCKGEHCCVSIAAIKGFILLTATCISTTTSHNVTYMQITYSVEELLCVHPLGKVATQCQCLTCQAYHNFACINWNIRP